MTYSPNSEKGSKQEVTKILDIKNEITIITTSNDFFNLSIEFIIAHNFGKSIDLLTLEKV
jgi:hypothetical protein